ncbi:MAG: SbmA/BacA-like family transporter [Lautropia sp.]
MHQNVRDNHTTIGRLSAENGRLGRLVVAFWRGEQRALAWALTVALVALTVAQVSIPVMLNYWSQQLFDALEQRNFESLLRQSGIAVLIIAANVAVMTSHLWTKRRLQVAWRTNLTDSLLDRWTVHGRDYQLGRSDTGLDNPDGRIAEDVRIATEYSVDLVHSLFYCVLLLASFAQILWVLSGPPEVVFGTWRVTLPGHLVWIALLYAGVGAVVATLLGQPLTRAASHRQSKEADFRFGLGRAREDMPPLAIGTVDPARRSKTARLFSEATVAWRRQTQVLMRLVMFSSTWTVLSQAAPILIAAPRYVTGAITLGVLMQTAQAFQQMINALSWPIDNMQKLAECRASFGRVAKLHERLVALSRDDTHPAPIVEPAKRPTKTPVTVPSAGPALAPARGPTLVPALVPSSTRGAIQPAAPVRVPAAAARRASAT